ncbi:hypothetical protein CL659_04875 [bacterium]|nr:hypothetical protein [bacterium]|tara:strand:+ start:5019 stop:5747 length:729 start_codon:yes stop_codon:yes gene_type:complete
MFWPWKRDKVLLRRKNDFNDIKVVQEKDGTNLLYLDKSSNIHSIYKHGMISTESYWDDFCIMPPIIGKGKIAILGLGGATTVYLYRKYWPYLKLNCWEIDPDLVDIARCFFGLADEENVKINIDNALSESFFNSGSYSLIIVDLFLDGSFLSSLQNPQTWKSIKKQIAPNGRLMVNLSGKNKKCLDVCDLIIAEFGNLCIKQTKEAANVLVFSGSLPDYETWKNSLPQSIKKRVHGWQVYKK